MKKRSETAKAAEGGDDTRARLVSAAAAEFARVGFTKANVRAICSAAGANVSAVKYHFGGKENLYRATWEVQARAMIEAEPMPVWERGSGDDPREALAEFMAWFMRLVLLEGDADGCAGGMLAHEAVEATGALETFVELCAGPIHRELQKLVVAILGKGAGKKAAADLTNGIVALCVNPNHSREILTRLGYPPPTDRAGVNRMAKNLARFALVGLEGFSSSGTNQAKTAKGATKGGR